MDLVKVGMSQDAHKTSIEMLKKLQADEFVLYLKTWNFHWNVTGMNFNDLHGLFLKQYEQLQGFVDDVAERIRALGGIAPGTQAEFLKLSRLKEEAGVIPPAKEMIKKLLEDHEAIIQSLREDVETSAKINDAGTNNFLSDLIMKHEKTAWMLRAYLEA
ncbi:DNA starvation/stationary phase protection protein [Candidatus Dependentiae bacterium HGW-Dependentiae-1]|nr:MAG: DNA starvation/stationary phase protection protein [Candidatus Dependentiae bacterium HGW-Dependentiae-1]